LPAGTPLDRRIGNIIWTQSPHSLYVDALLSLGALGVVALVYLWVAILRRRRRAALALGVTGTLVGVIVFSQAIFGITNMLDPAQGLLLGMLLQAACAIPPDSAQDGIAPIGARLEHVVAR
jgi:heme A synthase